MEGFRGLRVLCKRRLKMIVKAIDIDTNKIIFQGSKGKDVMELAEKSGKKYILDFQETHEENLIRKINQIKTQ